MQALKKTAYCLGLFTLLHFSLPSFALGAKAYIKEQPSAGDFPLVTESTGATLVIDSADFPGVIKAANQLQIDIQAVTQKKLAITNSLTSNSAIPVIIGTIGKSAIIDKLIQDKKIAVDKIKGQWDGYHIQLVSKPTAGIDQALVIVGANKRGTIYGIYDLSEQLGVSPWYWWADVPVKTKKSAYVDKNIQIDEVPKVKYRGIFLNDEAPALTNWVAKNYGTYNHDFYVKVFELLQRLRANYLWPAMWNNAFNVDDPLNMQLADEYGIIMGTSHHEPMMRAHKEWGSDKGKWDYHSNKKTLYPFWEAGIARNKPYESLITMGMRGDGDEPMSEGENISLLETIVKDQREIIENAFGKPAKDVPQVWALYKEVQGYYEKGMRVPDDVTLLWCDDNWGNIRRLPSPDERKRSGGAGVYYHFDYVGGPRSYRWINTNNIANVWEQMNLAYEFQANKIWIVNVGDLKPMEFPIDFFLNMAWNPEQWPKERINEFGQLWAEREFGKTYAKEISELVMGYSKHNSIRKPELQDENTYSQIYDDEAERVLSAIKNLETKADALAPKLAPVYKDAYFQLVQHPVKASAIITEMYDAVAKNHLFANQGRIYTNQYADKTRALFAKDAALQKQWDTELANGKWAHFMDQPHIGYTHWNNPPANTLPVLYTYEPHSGADMGVAIEANGSAWPQAASSVWPHKGNYEVPRFDPMGKQQRWIEIFNKGTTPFTAKIQTSAPWIEVDKDTSIQVVDSVKLLVSVNWAKAPKGLASGKINITGTGFGGASITVSALNNPLPIPKGFTGAVEADGVVAIDAANTQVRYAPKGFNWGVIQSHGRYDSSISVFPASDRHYEPTASAPYVEYSFFTQSSGKIDVKALLAPSWPFIPGHSLRYAIAVDDEAPKIVNFVKDMRDPAWEESVRSLIREGASEHQLGSAGVHKLRFYALDSGVTLERLVINLGGLKPSYLGPVASPIWPIKTGAPKKLK